MHAYFCAYFVWNMHLCAGMHVYLHIWRTLKETNFELRKQWNQKKKCLI